MASLVLHAITPSLAICFVMHQVLEDHHIACQWHSRLVKHCCQSHMPNSDAAYARCATPSVSRTVDYFSILAFDCPYS